jgi:type I restriction enzyme R subunit
VKLRNHQSVNDLKDEEDEAQFVQAFRKWYERWYVRSYTDFDWEDLLIEGKNLKTIKSKLPPRLVRVKQDTENKKTSILDDIDFELELIHRDQINV